MPARITSADRARIQAAVEEAEKQTSGEIVPLVVPVSGEYFWVHPLAAFKGVLLATVAMEVYSLSHPFPIPGHHWIYAQALGALVVGALSFVPALKRLAIGRKRLAAQVDERALAHFIAEGLTETKKRTGVLIYVSLFEHRVEILGDRGIHAKVDNDYWDSLCDALSKRIAEGRITDGIVEATRNIGAKLREHFPREADDENELPDHMRTRE